MYERERERERASAREIIRNGTIRVHIVAT
jgi:hypothetical protein